MRYLMVVPAPMHRLSSTEFAMEGAFAEHLRLMMRKLAPRFSLMTIAAPQMSVAHYAAAKATCVVIDEAREPLRFVELYPQASSKRHYALVDHARAVRIVRALIKDADLVHSHLSHDVFRPIEFHASIIAAMMQKPLLTITDIDNRKSADMNYRTGAWSFRDYALCKFVYDPLRDLQHRTYARIAGLQLFKEPAQVADYGAHRDNVKLFQDPNFSSDDVITPPKLAQKVAHLLAAAPLRVTYFGRFVPYKGVDRIIDAVAIARAAGVALTLTLMGSGPQQDELKRRATAAGLDPITTWQPPRPYGPAFFDFLHSQDLLMACPLSPDTPRSTWDAIASGAAVLAFDTPFYVGMSAQTGAVSTVPWPDVQALGAELIALAADRARLVCMITSGTKAAHGNTHDAWLQRRVDWLNAMVKAPS